MSLSLGTRLGPYEITGALGAGGMGEVYKARDTRLDRTVAVKILPEDVATDPQFRERFDREARAISQLTHPHICTLYDVGEQDGTAFLVMELLEGESLAARLEKGAVPVEQALTMAVDIAAALDAAHRAGIVHRDLKPGNVILTKTGAKLLDFGLAKTTAPAVATSRLSMLPTTPPATMTAAGTILGTFQYMAPEQIEGLEADARTDLFAFGCVLFEMLTGNKAFEGKTRASLLGAILKDEPPPVSRVLPIAPPAIDRIVTTCLAKDPDDRWQTARDLMRELKWVVDGALTGAAVVREPDRGGARRRTLQVAAAVVASGAIAGIGVWWATRTASSTRAVIRFQALPPTAAPLSLSLGTPAPDLAFSPDGTRIVFTTGAAQSLYVRSLDQHESVPLAGVINARGPFFAPDGEWIGYFQGDEIKKVSVHGGPSVTICSQCAQGNRGATWGADDTIVFAANGGSLGLRRVPAAGGDPVPVTTVDSQKGEQSHLWPEFLPGNKAILFTVGTAGTIENTLIVVRDLDTGVQTILVRGGSQPHYVATGHLVYGVAGTLRAVAFDLSRRSVTGSQVPVLEHVVTKASGSADFSVSRDGSLAYIPGGVLTAGQRLAWIDRQGHEESIPSPPRAYVYPRLSPDGQRVALDIRDQQNDIWIWDFSRRVLTRLTTNPGPDAFPVWTPDGQRIAYASGGAGPSNVFWQTADGSGVAERLTTSARPQVPWAFTPDGKMLVLRDNDPKTGPDVSVMSLEGERAVKALIHTPYSEINAELSPDGRWVAYQSNESGRDEIHVKPFPAVAGGHWQVSTEGGTRPLWSRSGRELFYMDLGQRIMAVPIQAGSSLAVGNPSFTGALVSGASIGGLGGPGRVYDVSPDGQRFIVVRNAVGTDEKTAPMQLNVVLNWSEELKQRVPTR